MTPFKCLTIAGSDSGAGAGIQADLKTFAALGVYGTSAITALTAQNTLGVRSIYPVPVKMLRDQIDAVLEDIGTDAIKIGMLHNGPAIRTICEVLRNFICRAIVVDPVLSATSGDSLVGGEVRDALLGELFPLATLVTPNIPEAEWILGRRIDSPWAMEAGAKDIQALGVNAVLLKGGHMDLKGECDDCLVYKRGDVLEVKWFRSRRIETGNTHGTGCTLSAAITARLACGDDLCSAVAAGKQYLSQALARGAKWSIGRGHGPIGH